MTWLSTCYEIEGTASAKSLYVTTWLFLARRSFHVVALSMRMACSLCVRATRPYEYGILRLVPSPTAGRKWFAHGVKLVYESTTRWSRFAFWFGNWYGLCPQPFSRSSLRTMQCTALALHRVHHVRPFLRCAPSDISLREGPSAPPRSSVPSVRAPAMFVLFCIQCVL